EFVQHIALVTREQDGWPDSTLHGVVLAILGRAPRGVPLKGGCGTAASGSPAGACHRAGIRAIPLGGDERVSIKAAAALPLRHPATAWWRCRRDAGARRG